MPAPLAAVRPLRLDGEGRHQGGVLAELVGCDRMFVERLVAPVVEARDHERDVGTEVAEGDGFVPRHRQRLVVHQQADSPDLHHVTEPIDPRSVVGDKGLFEKAHELVAGVPKLLENVPPVSHRLSENGRFASSAFSRSISVRAS